MKIGPIHKTTAASRVFQVLYEMIATGRLRRGEKMPPQDELARRLGVSRNTLREAVNKLSAMGLLVSRQGVGTTVESPNPGSYLASLSGRFLLDPLSVREFVEARISIERTTVKLAVKRAQPQQLARLRDILQEQQKALQEDDTPSFIGQDTAFHLTLAEMSGNRVLQKFLETIHDMLQRFIGEVSQLPGAIEDAFAFHSSIVQAIADRDAAAAEKQIASHLFDVVKRIESNFGIDLQRSTLHGFDLLQESDGREKKRRR